jgi:hypothetical protein
MQVSLCCPRLKVKIEFRGCARGSACKAHVALRLANQGCGYLFAAYSDSVTGSHSHMG